MRTFIVSSYDLGSRHDTCWTSWVWRGEESPRSAGCSMWNSPWQALRSGFSFGGELISNLKNSLRPTFLPLGYAGQGQLGSSNSSPICACLFPLCLARLRFGWRVSLQKRSQPLCYFQQLLINHIQKSHEIPLPIPDEIWNLDDFRFNRTVRSPQQPC